MDQILKNIRSLRELKGYSQEYMADRLGTTQSSYARFENGAKKIDYKIVQQVADIFEMDVCSIIHFHEQELTGAKKDFLRASGGFRSENKDMKRLKDRIEYLERLNDQLSKQLKDKEEIIELLKGNSSSS